MATAPSTTPPAPPPPSTPTSAVAPCPPPAARPDLAAGPAARPARLPDHGSVVLAASTAGNGSGPQRGGRRLRSPPWCRGGRRRTRRSEQVRVRGDLGGDGRRLVDGAGW